MDVEKLIEAMRLCGSTPKVDQCKQCAYWSGGDMSKCIPRMTTDASTALSALQAENEKLRARVNDLETQHRTELCGSGYDCVELGKLRAELEQIKAEFHIEDGGGMTWRGGS